MLHLHKTPPGAAPALPPGVSLVHEWFAGWRWERYLEGKLVSESRDSFETREQCLADARHRHAEARELHEIAA